MIRFVLLCSILNLLNCCSIYSKGEKVEPRIYSFLIICHKDLKGVLYLYDGCEKVKRKRINYHREYVNVQHEFDTLIVVFKNNRDTLINIDKKKFYEIFISKEGIKSYVYDERGFPI